MRNELDFRGYIREEWPGLATFLGWDKVGTVDPVSEEVEELQRAEGLKREEVKAEIRELYGLWYRRYSFVDGQFSELAAKMIEYTKVPGWVKFGDFYPSSGYRDVNGFGYNFSTAIGYALGNAGVLSDCDKYIRAVYPSDREARLGDERKLGVGLMGGGPLSDPFEMIVRSGAKPDLDKMIRGATYLFGQIKRCPLSISASDGKTDLVINVSSEKIEPSLKEHSLALIFERLMIAINKDDLEKYRAENLENQLLLLHS